VASETPANPWVPLGRRHGNGAISTMVGPAAADHLHAATIAVTGQVPIDSLWHAVPAFPTASEFWLGLLESYGI
jgi:hypothetical protein